MPDSTPSPVDRRLQRGERTHRAIIDAAAALMAETGGLTFSVATLADRAGVARRTVFNHFASIDDVVAAVATDALGAVHDAVLELAREAPGGGPTRWLTGALGRADLLDQLSALSSGLGIRAGHHREPDLSAQQVLLLLRVLSEVGEQMTRDLLELHPTLDPLAVELEVARIMSALVVLYRHWLELTDGRNDADGRAAWTRLIERLHSSEEHDG